MPRRFELLSWLFIGLLTCSYMLTAGSTALADRIDPGFDKFRTPDDGSSFVDLTNFGLGIVPLQGAPSLLAPNRRGLGTTDTIIARNQGIDPFDVGDMGSVQTEIVALSLVSIDPIDIGGGEMRDLYITINNSQKYFDAQGNPVFDGSGVLDVFPRLTQPDPLDPSIGQMDVNHENQDGGTFAANFPNIFADAIFTFEGMKPFEQGAIDFSLAAPAITLDSMGEWTHILPDGYPNTPRFPAGMFYIGAIQHTGPHPALPTPEPSGAMILTGLACLVLLRRSKL